MNGLGQIDTSVFDPGYGYFDTGTVDTSFDLGYDFNYDYSFGTDLYDPTLYDPGYGYDPSLDTTLTDYGDVVPADYSYFDPGYDYSYDPASAIDANNWNSDPAYQQIISESAGQYYGSEADLNATAAEIQASIPDTSTAASSFSVSMPKIDWQGLLKTGFDIYKIYAQVTNPSLPAGKTAPAGSQQQPTVRINPQTGQPQIMMVDPRTGQTVPAVRDPATGQLVPQTMLQSGLTGQMIAGVPNWALLAGAGVALLFFMKPGGKAPASRRRRRK